RGIAPCDEFKEFGLRRRRGEMMQRAGHARLVAGLLLVADVDRAGRIFPGQNGHEVRGDSRFRAELRDLGRQLQAERIGDGSSIDDACCHWSSRLRLARPQRAARKALWKLRSWFGITSRGNGRLFLVGSFW